MGLPTPLADHSMGDSFLAPRRTTTCFAHL